jgi:hypothetical protein
VCQKPRYRRSAVTIRMEDKVREKDPEISHAARGIRNIDSVVGMVLSVLSPALVTVAASGQLPLLCGHNRTSCS